MGVALSLYPDLKDKGYFYGPCSYQPIIGHFGTVAVQVDDKDYQGDTRVLYDDGNGHIGYLNFGWGSCSGCDSLQACENINAVDELIERMRGEVQWFAGKEDAIKFFLETDWGGKYTWHQTEHRYFLKQAMTHLGITEAEQEIMFSKFKE